MKAESEIEAVFGLILEITEQKAKKPRSRPGRPKKQERLNARHPSAR